MASVCLEDERTLLANKIEEKSHLLFSPVHGSTELEVIELPRPRDTSEEKQTAICRARKIVKDTLHLQDLKESLKGQSQLFIIQQEHSWGRLRITRNFFEEYIRIYDVFPRIWKYMFAFGQRSRENEFGIPGFTCCRSIPGAAGSATYESSYILRRVELHGRELTDGQSPWSIRQVAVYHKWTSGAENSSKSNITKARIPQSTFLLIAPSLVAQRHMTRAVESANETGNDISTWYIHWFLIAESMGGWADYMAWLEKQLDEQTDKILMARIAAEDENLAQQTDFSITFSDRQNISKLEECTINVRMILSTMLDNMTHVRDQCKKYCSTCCNGNHEDGPHRDCSYFVEEFDRYAKETKMYVERTEYLFQRVRSTARLLSNLLDHDEAKALRDLTVASRREGKFMAILTFKGTRDAAAVKVLTVIGLIYLPTTIVANFFSTSFVNTNAEGNLYVSAQVWIFAAVSIPLTVLTIGLWWGCVYMNTLAARPFDEELQIPQEPSKIKLLTSLRRNSAQKVVDPEMGSSPVSVGTWSTKATTMKN